MAIRRGYFSICIRKRKESYSLRILTTLPQI
uniref:Ca2+ regulator and membrane fusion protein n=1 Tax=Podoviridae sp. ct8Lf7 TaxID=2827723 RepID=A0A8S5S143_9CAUD|nr:MAG TPA: Ca2+ regulator and membrane fusion protein [Podoviridae sp. ct8Lf7]